MCSVRYKYIDYPLSGMNVWDMPPASLLHNLPSRRRLLSFMHVGHRPEVHAAADRKRGQAEG